MSASELPTTVAEQQAALRRVALLIATAAPPADVFAAITQEVAELFRPRLVLIFRWEADQSMTVAGTWSDGRNPFPADSRWAWDDPSLVAVREQMKTGQPVRIDDVAGDVSGDPADAVVSVGAGPAAGAPVIVDGEVWGHIGVAMAKGVPLPDRIEAHLAEFAELVATTFSSSETREQLRRLADEQAALRRVATLVAHGAQPADVFHAVAEELGRLLAAGSSALVRFGPGDIATLVAGWGRLGDAVPVGARLPLGGQNVLSRIASTGRGARVDEYEHAASGTSAQRARLVDTTSTVGSPVIVAGQMWGAMVASVLGGSKMPPDAGRRVEQFTELIATAISNTEARIQLGRLAGEQAALRRVATLVAEEAPAAELFAKVAEEVAGIFGEQIDTAILRFDPDDTATVVAVWGEQPEGGIREGVRLPIDGTGVAARVHAERGVVRVDRYAAAEGPIADHARRHGITSAVGCPISVQGRVWGAMVVAHYLDAPFPADGERRVSQFTELMATALSNAEARTELHRLAAEQAALRRVAMLVAEAAAPAAVFDAVVTEVGGILGCTMVGMMRAEGPDHVVIVAHRGQKPGVVHVGMRLPLTGDSATARVLRTGRSTRKNASDDGEGTIAELVRRAGSVTTVGAPIVVEGRIWGVITASWPSDQEPPLDAEERLAEFAKLLDSAIANTDSRAQLTASRTRVLTAGDEARRWVVRDLHDGAQQRLIHAIVTLTLARKSLPADVDQATDLLDEALAHAKQGNEELRELAHGILPVTLTRGGLSVAIENLVARSDLPVRVEVSGERLPADIEASAYFIVAEALTNIVKHAGAESAAVAARVDGGMLRVVVSDDGAGGADPDGHGLLGLGDRAAALGGRLRIDSPPGGGTVVTAELPLTDARQRA